MSGATLWRAKWLGDGAPSLMHLAARLRAEAVRLEALAAGGWSLAEPVSDDYGTLLPPPKAPRAPRAKARARRAP